MTGLHLGTGVFRPINSKSQYQLESYSSSFLTSISLELQIVTFGTPMSFDHFIHLRIQLDTSDGGLTSAQFRDMFGECGGCERFMLMRSKDHHRCPGRNVVPEFVPEEKLFSLLDSTAGGQGLTTYQFHHLFCSCAVPECGLIFTRDAASYHRHIDEITDDEESDHEESTYDNSEESGDEENTY